MGNTVVPVRSNTRTVASNTFWYALDSVLGFGMAFATSIPIARIIGPQRLGYFSYIVWLTAMSSTLGSMGIPGTASKFMAEYLGRGETGIARAIYHRLMRVQTVAALLITAVGLTLVWTMADPSHRLLSTILVLAVLPAMLIAVPSQANWANESMRTNIPSSIASSIIYIAAVVLSLFFHWDLIGVAVGFLLSKTVDFVVRYFITAEWISRLPVEPLPQELGRSMYRFAGQQLYMAALALVVWDKSDVILLKALSPDIRQITFFTIVFNLVDKAVMFPQVFASSLSTMLLARFGRDRESVPKMAAASARYTFLFAAPLLLGMVLISSPLIRVLYGRKYLAAIPVMAIAAAFGIIRPMMAAVDAVFRANSRLGRMMIWATVCGVANIAIDALLIPHYGAVGAAIGNGTAQAAMVLGLWVIAARYFEVHLPWGPMAKIAISALAMAPLAMLCNRMLPAAAALVCDAAGGAVVFLLMLRLSRAVEPVDAERLGHVQSMLPRITRRPFQAVLRFLAHESACAPAIE